MTNILFKPWVGEKFYNSESRLLLLGESHYGDFYRPVVALATQNAVERWRSRSWRPRYFVAAARLLHDAPAKKIDVEKAFDRVAFYNFVQAMMLTVKQRPTASEFQRSGAAFNEVLQKLTPTHIVATGMTLWRSMPNANTTSNIIKLGNEEMPVRYYDTPSGVALATVVPHLSRAFSPTRWHAPIADFLTKKP